MDAADQDIFARSMDGTTRKAGSEGERLMHLQKWRRLGRGGVVGTMGNAARLGGGPAYVHDKQTIVHVLNQLRELRGRFPKLEIPRAATLKRIIATVFWASLERDEARPVNPRISYVSRPGPFDYQFKKPLPLTVRNIARLAPALPAYGALGVRATRNGVEIWGIDRATGGAFVADGASPGAVFLRSAFPILVLRGHESHRLDAKASELNLLSKLNSGAEKDLALGNRQARTILLRIAEEIGALAHGGAILVVPKTSVAKGPQTWWKELDLTQLAIEAYPPDCMLMEIRKAVQQSTDETDRLVEGNDGHSMVFDWSFGERTSLDDAIKSVAKLSGVDGAIVLDADLRVLGFGAKILSKPRRLKSVRVTWPFVGFDPQDVPLDGIGGTRHQSAIRFVYSTRGASAIVVSQDGPISVVGRERDGGRVIVMKHAELVPPR